MKRTLKTFRTRFDELRSLHVRFGDLVHSEKRLLGLALVALAGEVAFQLLGPFPLKYIFDGLLMPVAGARLPLVPVGFPQAYPVLFLVLTCLAMLVLAVGAGLFSYYRTIWSATAGQRMVMKLRKRLYAHLHRLSLQFHTESRVGDLLLRITGDIPMLRDVMSESLVELIGRIAAVVVTLGILVWLDPTLAVISIVVLLAVSLLSGSFSQRIVKVASKQRRHEGVLANTAGESLTTLPQVKAMGREDEVVDRFARQNRTSMRKGLQGTRLQAALSRWVELVFAAGVAMVMLFGVMRIQAGLMTAGDLLVFVALVHKLNKPLRKASRISGRIGKAAACGKRINEILQIEPEEIDRPGTVPAPALQGAVSLTDVSFSYNSVGTALDGVNLDIHPGERVAIVGRNGAGKTTLIHMLLRFFEPSQGTLSFDGVDARKYTLKSLRNQISVALQGTYLFGNSVRDNLRFSAPNADDAAMEHALKMVGADFVERLPEGLGTELQEGGADLSGGERRKLILAGTILRHSPILILDEPTAHIDRASRQDIIRRMPEIADGRTTILITHDPAMLRWVDRVVYLENGKVVAEGRHRQLQRRESGYGTLFPFAAPNAAAAS